MTILINAVIILLIFGYAAYTLVRFFKSLSKVNVQHAISTKVADMQCLKK